MILGDRLDELRSNVLRDRSAMVAGPNDSLWDDTSLLRYIKDAERKFARQTMCIRDSTSLNICTFPLKAGVTTYSLPPAVFAVISSKFDTDTFDIQRSGHALVLQFAPSEIFTYDPTTGYKQQPGRPIAYMTDETLVFAGRQAVTYTVYPTPSADENNKLIKMRTIRYPQGEYSLDNLNEESEIPEDYQFDCLQWAAYRATMNHDADAGDSVKAKDHEDAFDRAVMECKKEIKRTMFANVTVRYGTLGTNYAR
jgi:hypothetical protein